MKPELICDSSFISRKVKPKKQNEQVIDLTRVMQVKQAHRCLQKTCEDFAEIASQIKKDLHTCCKDVEQIRRGLSNLNGVIEENGVSGKEQSGIDSP